MENLPKDKSFKRNGETDENDHCDKGSAEDILPDRICWSLTIYLLTNHLLMLYALKLTIQGSVLWSTLVYGTTVGIAAGFSINIGAHRLWAHRSYKAKWPLRLLLVILQLLTVQSSIWQWVAWHRAHHKHSEKKLDPHNATKGFFYAHIGWLLTYDPKRFRLQLETINMEDVEADPIVMWQERNYDILFVVVNILMAVAIPWYCFGEDCVTAFVVCGSGRAVVTRHLTFLVNSAAHLYGYKPYNTNINPRENKLVSYFALGEGWHNYHHTFPWDYRASEYGGFYRFNPSAALIEFFAKIGWAYDLKTVQSGLVAARMKNSKCFQRIEKSM